MPTRKSCEIFSGYARSVEANGGASMSSQRIRPIRRGKNIAQTLRRSRHWSLSEPPKLGRIRWYENRLVASQGSSSRWAPFFSLESSPVLAQSPAAQRGLTFVRVHCEQCHAIDTVSDSPPRHRAPVPHIAPQIPDREPAPALGRRHSCRPSDDAAIPTRNGSDRGYHCISADIKALTPS